jgi:hypothetical protein
MGNMNVPTSAFAVAPQSLGNYGNQERSHGGGWDRVPSLAYNGSGAIGHWELDTIIGKGHKQAIVSMVERKSGYAVVL